MALKECSAAAQLAGPTRKVCADGQPTRQWGLSSCTALGNPASIAVHTKVSSHIGQPSLMLLLYIGSRQGRERGRAAGHAEARMACFRLPNQDVDVLCSARPVGQSGRGWPRRHVEAATGRADLTA